MAPMKLYPNGSLFLEEWNEDMDDEAVCVCLWRTLETSSIFVNRRKRTYEVNPWHVVDQGDKTGICRWILPLRRQGHLLSGNEM